MYYASWCGVIVIMLGVLLLLMLGIYLSILLIKLAKNVYLIFLILCVGRGVLRFWDVRYRKTRSNFTTFSEICADSKTFGVDII